MRTILEQNFDELYAQVEERVKCIKPVKHLDTFSKVLMWTSLNDIIIDVFGESRFMWMIDSSDTEFAVTFIDRYRLKETKQLHVRHSTVFVWPEKQEILNMSLHELESFAKLCNDNGYTRQDITCRYSKSLNSTWFHTLLANRRNGSLPQDEYVKTKLIKRIRKAQMDKLELWSPSKIILFKTVYVLKEFKCPLIKDVLRSIIHDDESVKFEFEAVLANIYGKNTSCAMEKYINKNTVLDVQDVIVEYIDRICDLLLLIASNDIKQTEIDMLIQRALCFVVGVQRKQVRRYGRKQRVCSYQESNKIMRFVEQLRDIKTNILITANNAYNLKDTNLLLTTNQDFDISTTNNERRMDVK